MTTVVASAGLAVNERIEIRRNRITGCNSESPSGKRVCIVTGTHGDELEGQYVCAETARILNENLSLLNGTVDIYPALNPLGIDSITRGIPLFDLDMNRIFPGSADGTMAESLAADIIADISGADICIDIHSSNIYLKEIPQIRINEISADELLPYASMLNCDFIWIHSAATVLESTLAYSLNSTGTKTLVVEMGVGMRITKEYCRQLTAGIFNLLKNLGMIIPCVNYYSMNIGKRFWTMDNTDINRMFPGYDLGETTQRIADGLFKEIQGYTYGIQLASFYQQGDFLPHVKLMEADFTNHEDMKDFGLQYAFVRTPRPYDTTTLNYNWQIWGTKAFSLYTNATDDIDEISAKAAVDAIIRFMVRRGIIKSNVRNGYVTEIINENRLIQIHSPASGICKSYVHTGDEIHSGDLLCEITDSLEGNVISRILSPVDGIVFFKYNRPLEFEKSVLYKIIKI